MKTIEIRTVKCVIISLCCFSAFVFSSASASTRAGSNFKLNETEISTKVSYYSTSTNFDGAGNKVDLAANGKLKDIELETKLRHILFQNIGIITGFKYNNVDTNNGTTQRNNATLSGYNLGIDYNVYEQPNWNLVLEALFVGSSEAVDQNTNEAIASDGASEARVGVTGYLKLGSMFETSAGVSYNYRTEGLASLLLYNLKIEALFNSVGLGIAYIGLSPVNDDDFVNQTSVRDNVTSRVNAGSKKYYSVNPSSGKAIFDISYNFNSGLKTKLFFGSELSGQNTSQGNTFGAELSWVFGGMPVQKAPVKVSQPLVKKPEQELKLDENPESKDQFKVDTEDGVNQNIFQPNQPKKK